MVSRISPKPRIHLFTGIKDGLKISSDVHSLATIRTRTLQVLRWRRLGDDVTDPLQEHCADGNLPCIREVFQETAAT
jgi:hypothetical protein